jgi:hypothetical protein
MGNPPRAHRRLVPRVPKGNTPSPEVRRDEPDDLEVTAQRSVDVVDDHDDDFSDLGRPPVMPKGSIELPDESLEMTAVRDNFVPPFDDIDELDEMTAQRAPVYVDPPPDEFDDDDAHETSAHLPRAALPLPPQRESLAHMLAERAVPQFDDFAPQAGHVDANAFSDSEPTSLKAPTSPDAEDRPMTHISPAEIGLLAAMAEGHEASRMVYMKWLEKRGEVVRAEFLRLDAALAQMSPEDPRYPAARRRILELAPRIGIDWRSRVSRSLIEGCTTTTGRCPSYWRALPTDSDDVRHCNVCNDNVFYCVSIDLARSRRTAGQRVAVDLSVERYHGDLDARSVCVSCRAQVPANTRFCPHCGSAQR